MSKYKKDPYRLLWILDDGVGFDPRYDMLTTETLIKTARTDQRFIQFVTTISQIATMTDGIIAMCVAADDDHLKSEYISMQGSRAMAIATFDAVFIRVDPPITERIRHAMIQLTRSEREEETLFINSPSDILMRGSKLFNLEFNDVIVENMVRADPVALTGHIRRSGGQWVVKPLDRAGGEGVVRLDAKERGLKKKLITLVEKYGFLNVQPYLPVVETEGEIRHLVFGGEIIAAWRKLPSPGDFRANLDQGAFIKALASDHDYSQAGRIIARVAERVPGFRFYSLDMIGPYLNELNVENTGGLPNADELYGVGHANKILEILISLINEKNQRGGQVISIKNLEVVL